MPADPNATGRDDSPTPPAGGRYVFGDEIARGGMGAILRATDTTFGREVAVKVLLDKYSPDSGTARRFDDEARITGQLQHPGIPPVHDLGTLPDGRPFLAMKLIKGNTLDYLLKTRPDPAADRGRFVAVFETLCQAVAYAHAHDVIHRDLKPANVMVGAFGEVQVLDWGLAKVLTGRRDEGPDPDRTDPATTAPGTDIQSLRDANDPLTRTGSVLGTPAYMPPEQAIGAVDQIDRRSDVFGLGGILAAVLTGHPPFASATAESTRQMAAKGKVEGCFARLDACGADPELVTLCRRCLSAEPAGRPADAGEVASAVAGLRADAEARARQAELDRVRAEGERATAEATAAEQRKRRRVQLMLAAAAVLLVAGAGAVTVWRVDEEGKKRTEAARLEVEEGERTTRAADAVGDLLDRTKAALEAGDAARAAPLLDQAGRRAADDAVIDHADRLTAYRRDLAMLLALDRVNDFRWTALDSKPRPPPERVAEQWAAAFAGFGIVPGTTPPAEAAARTNDSLIRPVLVAGLDGWLALAPSSAVRDLLAATDPDPFRDEVRRQLAAGDAAGLAGQAGRPEWSTQPSGLVLAYGSSPAVPAVPARELLLRLAVARRTDFALMMQLGATYPINTPDVTGERARWYQVAAALRPENPAVLNNLGVALFDRKNLDGAVVAYREAIRLDPRLAGPHTNLGNVLLAQKDLDGAAAAHREATRLDPKFALARVNLGNVLLAQQDLDGAAAAYHEAIRLDPKNAHPHYGLGNVLFARNDLDGAAAAYHEAIRLDPKNAHPHFNLGLVYESRLDLDQAEAMYREVIRLDPRIAVSHANLGDVLRKQARHADAVAAYRAALDIQPTHASARAGLDYCERVRRGEVPTAPPPRAVAR